MNGSLTGDSNLIKELNKSVVLNTIESQGPISRAQISKDTGLNKATVSTMVQFLLDESLVNEIGFGKSGGGRKPMMLYFNNKAGYSIGIDIGVNYILAILTDLNGNIIQEINEEIKNTKEDIVIQQIFNTIELLMKSLPRSPYGVIGIGIGIPAMVDKQDKILFAPNLDWKNVKLKEVIEEKFNIPTSIKNEANSGALGELNYGVGKNSNSIIYISVGIGIGAGIVVNKQLYTGANGISGELGHLTIDVNGKKCSCGNRGCWELYASEKALFNSLEHSDLSSNKTDVNIENIIAEAKNGNNEVLNSLNSIGEYLGIGIVNTINSFNPETVIIGNRFALFENWITNPINRVVQERLFSTHKSTEILFAKLGKYSIALGASSFMIKNFFLNKK